MRLAYHSPNGSSREIMTNFYATFKDVSSISFTKLRTLSSVKSPSSACIRVAMTFLIFSFVLYASKEKFINNNCKMHIFTKTAIAHAEFEIIHPFIDGNGRIGHLLWAVGYTHVTGIWPEKLPPNFWGDSNG